MQQESQASNLKVPSDSTLETASLNTFLFIFSGF